MDQQERRETYNIDEGLLKLRWGDSAAQLQRLYPQALRLSRPDLRAFGKLLHIPDFLTLSDGTRLQAITDDPHEGIQVLWLDFQGDPPEPGELAEPVKELLAKLSCDEARYGRDGTGSPAFKGEDWQLYVSLEPATPLVVIEKRLTPVGDLP